MRIELNKSIFLSSHEWDDEEILMIASNRPFTLLFQARKTVSSSKSTSSSSSSPGPGPGPGLGPGLRYEYDSELSPEQGSQSQSQSPIRTQSQTQSEIMSKFTFSNVFDNHTPKDIEKLDSLFNDCQGTLPSRRQLSAIAQSIGIQQSKIRKWFEKRSKEQEDQRNDPEEQRQQEHEQSSKDFWDKIDKKMDKIDEEIENLEEFKK